MSNMSLVRGILPTQSDQASRELYQMSRKSIFITGAAAGIGRATAKLFAAKGYFVGLYDIDDAGLKVLAQELGEHNTCSGRLDVTAPENWSQALAAFMQCAGRLDVLVNNAGVLVSGSLQNESLTVLHRVIDINFKGVLNGCYLALPYLRKTPDSRVIKGGFPRFIGLLDFKPASCMGFQEQFPILSPVLLTAALQAAINIGKFYG